MKTPQLRDDLCVREIEGEAVILDKENERIHSFNLTAACILQAIDGNRTTEDIGRVLVTRFKVSPETAFSDAEVVIAQLEELGLVEEADSVSV